MANKRIQTSEPTSKQIAVYVILGILIMICLGTVYSWSIFRTYVESLYQIGATQSGLPYMTSFAVFALLMIITGRYLDNANPRVVILIGAALVGLGWFLSGFMQNILALTLTYGVIVGAGVGVAYGAPIAVLNRWLPGKSGGLVGLMLVGFGISPLVTAPLARMMIENMGLLATFRVLGITFGVLIALLALPFRYPDSAHAHNQSKAVLSSRGQASLNTASMMKTTSFRGLYLSLFAGTAIGLTQIGLTSSVAVDRIGLPAQTAALLISFFALFNGLGRPVFGWLTDRLSIRKTMLISYSLIFSAALLMLAAGVGDIWLFIIASALFWFNQGGWLAIAPTATHALYGSRHYGQNYGVVYSAYGVAALTGVPLTGLLLDAMHSYNPIYYLVMAICLGGLMASQCLIKE